MRWATYLSPSDGADRAALLHDGALHGLRGPERLVDLLSDRGGLLATAGERALADPLEVVPESEAVLRAPIPAPPSIRDFMAFEEHVVTSMAAIGQQLDPDWYEIPVFYFTNPAAVLGPFEDVPVSPGSTAFDYELEVAAVVGAPGADLDPDQATAHIAGYTILCDWSARDLQMREMRLGLGPAKGKDSATTLGPYLVTPDELGDLDVAMTASVNGTRYSAGRLSDLFWSFGQLLAYASRGPVWCPATSSAAAPSAPAASWSCRGSTASSASRTWCPATASGWRSIGWARSTAASSPARHRGHSVLAAAADGSDHQASSSAGPTPVELHAP